jgi:hypothetical protein
MRAYHTSKPQRPKTAHYFLPASLPQKRARPGPKGSAEMVAAAIGTIFAQPDAHHVHEQLDVIAGMLGRQFPTLEVMLHEAATEVLAFTSFPISHWKKIWSTNPWSGSTRRSSVAPMSWGCSPTPRHSFAWPARCWSRPTTSGRSATAATSPKLHGPARPSDQGGGARPAPAGIDSPTLTRTAALLPPHRGTSPDRSA